VVQDGSPAASRAGRGFSHFFGLNDIFQSSTPLHFDTGLTSATVGNFTSGTIRLEIRGPSNEVYQSINYTPSASDDFGTIITALNTQAGGYMTFSLNSAGALVATPAANYSKATVGVVSDTTTRGGASGISFTALFGVGDRYRIDAAANMAVAPGLANTPSRLPTAALSLTGTPNLAPSDGTGAKAYQALQTSTQQFGAAGNVPAIAATLGQYAAALLTASGQAAKDTASSLTDKQALKTELSGRQSSVSGVNTDEELSNMVVYQQAYNACARLITTTKEMFDTLLSIAK
jgi:flagellar hook-associated protein 1 FlgK